MSNQPDEFAHFDFAQLAAADTYKLLVSLVMPRPIAWVVSRDASGRINAAPFSFFNVMSADPPILGINFSGKADGQNKDSLANIKARGEFVVNVVSEELAEAMNITATNAPTGVDETQLARLELTPSTMVDVPRISRSPAAMECKLAETLNFGGTSTLCLGRILCAHVRTDAFKDLAKLHIDPAQLRLIGRMNGQGRYCTTRDMFNLERKKWPLSGS